MRWKEQRSIVNQGLDHSDTENAWRAFQDGRFQEAFSTFYRLGKAHLRDRDWSRAGEAFSQARLVWIKPVMKHVGVALWLQDQCEAACRDWANEIARRRSGEIELVDAAGGVEVPALLWWASSHDGLSQWKGLAVEELRRRWRTKWCQSRGWPGPIAAFLLGKSSAEMLLSAAHTSVERLGRRQLSQAHFYIGAVDLCNRRTSDYETQLRKVLDYYNPHESECLLAAAELGGQNPTLRVGD